MSDLPELLPPPAITYNLEREDLEAWGRAVQAAAWNAAIDRVLKMTEGPPQLDSIRDAIRALKVDV